MKREPYSFKEWNIYEGDKGFDELEKIAKVVSKEIKKYNLSFLEAEIVLKITKSICKNTKMVKGTPQMVTMDKDYFKHGSKEG